MSPHFPRFIPICITAIPVLMAAPVFAAETIVEFNISAQSLADALLEFSQTSGLKLFYSAEMTKNIKSSGLNGKYTAQQGLQKLLNDTGLQYKYTGKESVTIEKAPATHQSNQADPITLPKVTVVGSTLYDVKDPYNEDYVLPNATAGTKTDTPIMETPLNVQVISKQVLKDQQVITLADSLNNVSGVITNPQSSTGNLYFNGGGSATNITLRGFTSETTFRNGFRLQQGGSNRDMANVESVEILKGPAAILYGMVEPGGMVNVITKQPLATPYYALNQQFGSFNNYRTTVDATGPVANNKDVLYRMNMSYQNSGSFRDFVGTDDLFLAPVLKWNITPKTQVTFELEYNHKHNGADVGSYNPSIGGQLNNIPINTNYGSYSPSITDNIFGGLNWSHQFNDDWSIKHRFSVNQQHNSANGVQQPVGTFTGDSMANYFGANTSGNSYYVLREGFGSTAQNNTYSTNLDLTGHFDTLGLKHTSLVGGDYYRLNDTYGLNYSQSPSTAWTIVDPFNPVQPGTPISLGGYYPTPSVQTVQTDQFGVYGQDQIKLPYDVHVTGGIRYQNYHQNNISTVLGSPASGFGQSQDAVTPRVGILWHPQRWVSLYANYAESFGANNGLVYAGSGQAKGIAATSASQYEGGLKTEFFDGRLRGTLAYFDLTKTNIATADTGLDPSTHLLHDCGSGPGSCSLAIGAVRSRGPELDIQGELLPGWNAIATYTNIDINVIKTNANNDSLNGINVGDRMFLVPRNTASFWTTYELLDTDYKGLKFGGGVTVRDGQMTNGGADASFALLPPAKIPGYATVGLMTAYSHAYGKSKVSIQLNINNLLDQRYYTSQSILGNNPNEYGTTVNYGAPRTFIGSIRVEF